MPPTYGADHPWPSSVGPRPTSPGAGSFEAIGPGCLAARTQPCTTLCGQEVGGGGGGARDRSARTARPCPVIDRLVGGLLRFAWYICICAAWAEGWWISYPTGPTSVGR